MGGSRLIEEDEDINDGENYMGRCSTENDIEFNKEEDEE